MRLFRIIKGKNSNEIAVADLKLKKRISSDAQLKSTQIFFINLQISLPLILVNMSL